MTSPWNLESTEWARVLASEATLDAAVAGVLKGESLPWTDILLRETREGSRVLDLGAGRGEHSAHLALKGRRTTLVDFSVENLAFSEDLYRALGKEGRFCQADITQPLPFASGSYDLVFSCGVFEYFTASQIGAILKEMFRVSTNRVVVMVPNALSIPYRLGKWYMERTRNWPWGGEVPSYSLKQLFRQAGSVKTEEFSLAARHSLNFLTMPFGSRIRQALTPVLTSADESQPALLRQGYLLVTIGQKEKAIER
jgi:ubiquinone/menaquinone biosynthesis C-methylase UbiE